MRILLVEDEKMLSEIIKKGLRSSGYAVDCAFDGEDALYQYEVNDYDLIVLDLNLPKIDGFEVLKKVREKDLTTKILILSARITVEERIKGLDKGANDYLIKPFDFGELEARIRNLMRMDFTQLPGILDINGIRINLQSKSVEAGGQSIVLPRKEYNILEYLVMHKNQIISAEQLVEHIWDNDYDPFSNVLRYHICSLKKKLTKAGKAEIIKTVRGQGYIIMEAGDEEVSKN